MRPELQLLCDIRHHHIGRASELKSTGNLAVERLQSVPGVHSLKVRIKDPDHLVAKVIRMGIQQPDLKITLDSYEEYVKDLIGVRALHLFKDEWLEVHKFVAETWEALEDPVAYIREGDEIEREQFKAAGCRVEVHPYGYRSIHYRFKSQPFKHALRVELQVRTIFEEAWSEIDHKLRYPRQSSDPTLTSFLVIFNRLAGFGDEMGMYAKHLNSTLRTKSEQLAEAECRQQAQEQELRKMLSQVQIGKKDKAELQKKLDALERTSRDAREVRVNVRDLMAGISPSIIGSLTNLCIAPPAGVAVPSFLLVSPSATSIEVKVPNPLVISGNVSPVGINAPRPLFGSLNATAFEVKNPIPLAASPNPVSVEGNTPTSVTTPVQGPLSKRPVNSNKSREVSKARTKYFRRRKQRQRAAENKP